MSSSAMKYGLVLSCVGLMSYLAWCRQSSNQLVNSEKPASSPEATPISRRDCGASALYLALSRLGVKSTLTQLISDTEITPKGTSLLKISLAAKRLGLEVTPLKLSFLELVYKLSPGTVAILHLETNHFVVAESSGASHQLVILDSSKGSAFLATQIVVENQLGWQGNCILLTNENSTGRTDRSQTTPINEWQESIAQVCFSPSEVKLGQMPIGETFAVAANLKNTSGSPIRIVAVRPDCGCASAQLARDTLPGISETRLDVTVSAVGLPPGSFRRRVLVITDQGNSAELTIVGEVVRTIKVSPSFLHFSPDFIKDRPSTADVFLTNTTSSAVTIAGFEDLPDSIAAISDKKVLASGQTAVITFIADSTSTLASDFKAIVRTSHVHESFIAIPIRITPTPVISPRQL